MSILAAIVVALAAVALPDSEAAEHDRARYPREEWGYHYYGTSRPIEPAAREAAGIAFKLTIASVSPTEEIERATPRQITPTLYHLDLRDLGFRFQDWQELARTYPYSPQELALVHRIDWLTLQLSDLRVNPTAYYKLALGGVVPKTRDEIIKILGVDTSAARSRVRIEGASGVSVRGTRWLEDHAAFRGFAWGTRDVLKLTNESDPIEHPLGDFKHDGEEWLIYRPKYSSETGAQGVLQFSFLANAAGTLVAAAPVALVEDHTTFRGTREVANPGSCMTCHPNGPNEPTRDQFRELLESGVQVLATDKDTARETGRLHLSDFLKNVKRGQEDYAAAVVPATGVDGDAATRAFVDTINRYDAALDLERAAFECGMTAEGLSQAITLASSSGAVLPARVVSLVHGGTIPRDQWEQVFLATRTELIRWQTPARK